MKRTLLPLAVFLGLLVFLVIGLRLNPRELPSPFIDKPTPAFTLTRLHEPSKTISPKDLAGQVWLLNVWASWCEACQAEHPVLMELANADVAPIVGLNYKDERDDGMAWLKRFGNPYLVSAYDREGRVGIEYGVYGVPETFVIDRQGLIRLKHVGPLTTEFTKKKVTPLIQELNRA
jgi:cytochrome c biogenesis protein CcmG, thiol:disulfide interchange protein DsbE